MKNKVYFVLSVLLLALSAYVFIDNYQEKENKISIEKKLISKHDSIQSKWKGRKLKISDSVINLKSGIPLNEEMASNYNKGYFLINYLDADCSDCVAELEKWEKLVDSGRLKFLNKENLIFIARSDHEEMLKYQVYNQANFDMNVYFDSTDNFADTNKIPIFKAYNSFLLENGEIVYIGSPIKEEYFIQEIALIVD